MVFVVFSRRICIFISSTNYSHEWYEFKEIGHNYSWCLMTLFNNLLKIYNRKKNSIYKVLWIYLLYLQKKCKHNYILFYKYWGFFFLLFLTLQQHLSLCNGQNRKALQRSQTLYDRTEWSRNQLLVRNFMFYWANV